jgi:hypothetical protein
MIVCDKVVTDDAGRCRSAFPAVDEQVLFTSGALTNEELAELYRLQREVNKF